MKYKKSKLLKECRHSCESRNPGHLNSLDPCFGSTSLTTLSLSKGRRDDRELKLENQQLQIIGSIILKNAALKKIQLGRVWLSKNDVSGRRPNIPGIVQLLDNKRKFAASAFVSPGFDCYLRIITKKNVPIDRNYWAEAAGRAFRRRERLSKITNAYRVVNSESDGVTSVIIDKYNDIWSIQITSSGAEAVRDELCDVIIGGFRPVSLIDKSGLAGKIIFGSKTVAEIFEGGQKFEIDVLHGQKTGAYLDYRNFRFKAASLAGGIAFDGFCYEGWLSCHIAGSAEKVIAVDSSASAIAAAGKNAELNSHSNIEFIKSDVLEFLRKTNVHFDFIHLDPPSYAKGGGLLKAAIGGYRRLTGAALNRLKADGILFVSSCSHAISERILEETVAGCVRKCGRKFEIIFRGIQDSDHPVLKGHPASLYLKAIALRVG